MVQRWKNVVQINEQCCIWKNNGKLQNRNRIDVKLESNKRDYLKLTFIPSNNQAICNTKYLTMILLRYAKTKLH